MVTVCANAGCSGSSGGGTPTPPPPPAGTYVTPDVTVAATSVAGYSTYTLTATLSAAATNVYSIYGTVGSPISFPPAFQVAAPFGADTGGVSPQMFAVMDDSQYDSWLTVGMVDNANPTAISAIGIDFDA
jgi:hypothetical protein